MTYNTNTVSLIKTQLDDNGFNSYDELDQKKTFTAGACLQRRRRLQTESTKTTRRSIEI